MLLVKHAYPAIVESKPAAEWKLCERGRLAARRLADELPNGSPFYASAEPKAVETAEIIAAARHTAVEIFDELGEQARRTVGFLSPKGFVKGVKSTFEKPDKVVFGEESANAARRRFAAAVERVTAEQPDAVIVAHGTVITLFVAEACNIDAPFRLWQRLGLPSAIELDGRQSTVKKVIGDIEQPRLDYAPFLRQEVAHGTSQRLLELRANLEEASDPDWVLQARGRLGELLRVARNYPEGREQLEYALELAEQLDDARASSINRLRLAILEQYDGRYEHALQLHRTALDQIREAGIAATHEDFCHQHRGKCLAEMQRFGEASEAFERALRIRQSRGDAALIASTLEALDSLDSDHSEAEAIGARHDDT